MHFHDWWMKFWGPMSFLEISTPSRDVMIVNYCSVNEKTVDKMNVKIVSAMLNEVRSILANTLEPDSFQINQFHNKDLSQHQLNWPGEWFCFINECFLFDFFPKNVQCFLSALKETYTSFQNKISPQCLCWGRNLRSRFPEESFTNSPDVSAKINSPIRSTNFSKKHSYIKQNTHLVNLIDVDSSLCCELVDLKAIWLYSVC